MSARRTALLIAAIAVGLAALLSLVIQRTSSGVAHNGQVGDVKIRADLLASASSSVGLLLTYRAATFDADVANADRVMTTAMRGDYGHTVTTRVRAQVLAHGIDLQTSVAQAGIISIRPDDAEVLMFLDQTTSATDAATHADARRVIVNLSRIGGAWLVSKLSYF